MNAAKVILVSTVVAAVFGLALSFGATSAEAHCRAKHLDNDGNCITHNVDRRSETFTVQIFEGEGEIFGDPLFTTAVCEGSSRRKQVRDATFPPAPGCEGLTITDGDLDLHLCQVNINHATRSLIIVTMFFTSGFGVVGGVLCPNADPDAVYQGEFDASFEDPDACEAGDTCTVIINEVLPLTLKKSQQPNKGAPAGEFTVDTIVWNPVE